MPRRVRFTAKATIFANPLVAAFLHRVGVVPLPRAHDGQAGGAPEADRNAAAVAAVASALAEGAVVLIFPEGRSHDEPKLAPLYGDRARRLRTRARAWRRFRRDPAWHRRLLEDADWLRTEAGAPERLAVAG
jgi:1-acyl-sn-glycerol-3-phosphate acyltransferase